MEKKLGKATRDAYGLALAELGRENSEIVVLDADLSKSTKTVEFAKVFPERFFNVGIMEAHMVGVAAGLASAGKIPFISSFSCFLMCKGFEQMRMSVAFPELNVKIVVSHGGISIGEDGASQMSIEDFALALALPNFVSMVPADEYATRELIRQAAAHKGPVFMRTCRPKAPLIYGPDSKFQMGKGVRLREGRDVTLVATGLLVWEALEASETLKKEGIDAGVIDIHTLKPLDEDLLVEAARKTGRVVVAEEHQIWGGLGSAVARVLSQKAPCKMGFAAIQDVYGESGPAETLFDKYGLSSPHIVKAAKALFN